jgi:hypothetical protein
MVRAVWSYIFTLCTGFLMKHADSFLNLLDHKQKHPVFACIMAAVLTHITISSSPHAPPPPPLLALQPRVGSWPPTWFCNSKFFRGGVVSPTPNLQPGGPYPLTCLARVAPPGAYASASIALQVIGARKPPFHDNPSWGCYNIDRVAKTSRKK